MVITAATANATIAARATGTKAPMALVRNVDRGERVTDLFNEIKSLQWRTGNEHAIVKLANGDRAIVAGGPNGIEFADGQIAMLYAHTHPYDAVGLARPSPDDFQALRALGQSSSWLLERGQLVRFWAVRG